jgi:anti-sigma B factor antagonist
MSKAAPVSVEVERRTRPPLVLVRISGELDFGTTPRLLAAVGGEPPPGASMVLDLSRVDFCDSSALGAMIALHKAARDGGGRLYLTGAHPQVLAAIRVTSLDRLFHIRTDVDAVCAEIAGS